MRARIVTLVAGLALLLGTLVFGPASSADAAPNGTQAVKVHDCRPIPVGGQTCIDEQAEFQNVGGDTSASGISGATVNGQRLLINDNGPQGEHLSEKLQFKGLLGTHCLTINYSVANGQVQYDSFSDTRGAC